METNFYVVKSNALIRNTKNPYSQLELKVVLYLVSRLAKGKEDLTLYVSIEEFFEALEMTKSGMNSRMIREALECIRNKELEIDEKNVTVYISIIEQIDLVGKGLYKIKLADYFHCHLLNLSKDFTRYSYDYVKRMNSKHAIRLYEYFKSYEYMMQDTNYVLKLKVDTLKAKLGVSDLPSYIKVSNFRRYLLDKAIAQINYYTDIIVRLKTHKSGRIITHFTIYVLSKGNDASQYIQDEIAAEIELNIEEFDEGGNLYDKKTRILIEELVKEEADIENELENLNRKIRKLREKEKEIKIRRKQKELKYHNSVEAELRMSKLKKENNADEDWLITELQSDLPF